MKEPILVIMAAGMGSRYGGLKQMDPVGPDGEAILDYSLFDARRAGFKRAIILIKHEIEEDFMRVVGNRLAGQMEEVRFAFQQVDKVPEGFAVPDGRVKPWGAVLPGAHRRPFCGHQCRRLLRRGLLPPGL